MFFPFRRKPAEKTIFARVVQTAPGEATIDVRGQTCPGYLLAINRAVDALPPATHARLLITYPPCGEDVHSWCKSRGIELIDIEPGGEMTVITVYKP